MVKTTFTVKVGDKKSILTAEIDTREDGHNAGRSNFRAGDPPIYFLIHKTADLKTLKVFASIGEVKPGDADGKLTDSTTETETFTVDTTEGDTFALDFPKPVTTLVDSKWIKKDAFDVAFELVDETSYKITKAKPIKVKDVMKGTKTRYIGILEMTYKSQCEVWSLKVPDTYKDKTIEVVVSIWGFTDKELADLLA